MPRGESVTRLRGVPRASAYSDENTLIDWSAPSSLAIDGCAFDPGGSSEPTEDGRARIVTSPTLYAPAGADITSRDRVEVRGDVYLVDGEPADWRNPFTGWRPGLVIRLKRVEG